MKQRYFVGYNRGPGYRVTDGEAHAVVFESLSKPEVIAKAQELNGFEPVDGDERTYARQTR